MNSTYVCYHIPSDRDDGEHPNAFAIHKSTEEVTLKDVKDSFPLPGEYHFRFKVKMEGGSYWLDFNDDNAPVPSWGPRRIISKVLRLSWNNVPKKPLPAVAKESATRAHVQVDTSRKGHSDLFGGSSPPRSQKTPINGVTELDLFS